MELVSEDIKQDPKVKARNKNIQVGFIILIFITILFYVYVWWSVRRQV